MNYIDNPIILNATSTRPSGEYTFHRVVLRIAVSGLGNTIEYPQSRPVITPGETLAFNIAPTFHAYAAQYHYAPVGKGGTLTVPSLTANVYAHDEYMCDGVLVSTPETTIGSNVAGDFGHYTDYELYSASHTDTVTRKPVTGQLVMAGTDFVEASTNITARQSVSYNIADADAHKHKTMGSVASYVLPNTRRGAQFQFVNSRGLIESAHAFSISAEKLRSGSSSFTRFVHPLSHIVSRRVVSKKPSSVEFTFSSGFVSYQWARWWADEFCQSAHHWMLVDGTWIPVHVTLSDSTTIIDRSKAPALCNVDFTVTPDVNGGLW